jgi:hypothetical protein
VINGILNCIERRVDPFRVKIDNPQRLWWKSKFRLRVLRIFHHGHVQLLLAFTECNVRCAITRRDLKYM